jgi:leukotriene-A4 hydrolase
MGRPDPHSHADDTQPCVEQLELRLELDPKARRLSGVATLHLDRPAEGRLDLDARGLSIERIEDAEGAPLDFELGPDDPVLGPPLRVALHGDRLSVHYSAAADASALQWLEPAQTDGGRHPYVFTQCQPIHARSLFPCQDSPRVRMRYRATLRVPSPLVAVMAAAAGEVRADGDHLLYDFIMDQPIPPYLFAFAVGELVSRDLGPRSRVWAEPSVLEAAADEFRDVDRMLTTAESLFGPYDWERFDVLVMPPSFPYGGMENPRLTFVTPTLIVGDRSLVNVLAHELAHSWTGNLVTNASMDHFWLNEGFTTYAERRIVEALEGEAAVRLHAALGFEGLGEELARFGAGSPMTRLRTDLAGLDPDAVYSRVPYEKGYLFLARIEAAIGRPRFDALLKRYIERFRFRSITTDDFLGFLHEVEPGVAESVDLAAWIDGPDLPEDAPRPRSERLEAVQARARRAASEPTAIGPELAEGWDANDWQVFLAELPSTLPVASCRALDETFDLSRAPNAEIRMAFLALAARSGDHAVDGAIGHALGSVGRMKYLRPLYDALVRGDASARALARAAFEASRGGYHPVAAAMVGHLLDEAGA